MKDLTKVPTYNVFAIKVWFDTEKVYLEMKDGRIIGAPLAWFPRLANATNEQRNNWELVGRGVGIHWKDIDEDLSAEGMFRYISKNSMEEA
jgi:hypothetical protein